MVIARGGAPKQSRGIATRRPAARDNSTLPLRSAFPVLPVLPSFPGFPSFPPFPYLPLLHPTRPGHTLERSWS